MARRKKRPNLGPRRKRMRRPARLQAAAKWRSGYGGKNIVRGYARWFGVDLVCAIAELRMLGVTIEPEYEQQVRRAVAACAEERATKRAEKRETRRAETLRPPETGWPYDLSVNFDPADECPF